MGLFASLAVYRAPSLKLGSAHTPRLLPESLMLMLLHSRNEEAPDSPKKQTHGQY